MDNNTDRNIKVGEFLVNNGIITKIQLNDALDLQKDNTERVIGEILVTQGVLTKEELVMALEMFLMTDETGSVEITDHVDEWLDQDEVDMLLKRINEKDVTDKSS